MEETRQIVQRFFLHKTHYVFVRCFSERLLFKVWLESSSRLLDSLLTGYLVSRSFVNILRSSRVSRIFTIPENSDVTYIFQKGSQKF
jgi:hypothetical protein